MAENHTHGGTDAPECTSCTAVSSVAEPQDGSCVICGSSEQSPQGGLCPRHTYDEGPQAVTTTPIPEHQKTADPVAEVLTSVPVTGLRFTGPESFLTRNSARRLAAALREQGLITHDPATSAAAEYLRGHAPAGTPLQEAYETARARAAGNKDAEEKVRYAAQTLGLEDTRS